MAKVVVMLSGGLDSTVLTYWAKSQGHDLHGRDRPPLQHGLPPGQYRHDARAPAQVGSTKRAVHQRRRSQPHDVAPAKGTISIVVGKRGSSSIMPSALGRHIGPGNSGVPESLSCKDAQPIN